MSLRELSIIFVGVSLFLCCFFIIMVVLCRRAYQELFDSTIWKRIGIGFGIGAFSLFSIVGVLILTTSCLQCAFILTKDRSFSRTVNLSEIINKAETSYYCSDKLAEEIRLNESDSEEIDFDYVTFLYKQQDSVSPIDYFSYLCSFRFEDYAFYDYTYEIHHCTKYLSGKGEIDIILYNNYYYIGIDSIYYQVHSSSLSVGTAAYSYSLVYNEESRMEIMVGGNKCTAFSSAFLISLNQ